MKEGGSDETIVWQLCNRCTVYRWKWVMEGGSDERENCNGSLRFFLSKWVRQLEVSTTVDIFPTMMEGGSGETKDSFGKIART